MKFWYDSSVSLLGLNLKTCSHKTTYMNVHSTIIHNDPK
jgi:hypothetical protein